MSRLGAWVRRLAAALLLVLVFCASLLVGAGLHLNLRAVRRIVERVANAALSSLPEDKVRLSGVADLTMRRARVDTVDVEIAGVGRVHAENVTADVRLFDTLITLVRRGPIAVRAKRARVSLVDFELRPGKRLPKRSTSTETAKEVQVDVERFAIDHVYAHGRLGAGPALDLDADRTTGSFAYDPRHVRVDVATSLTARGILSMPIVIDLDGAGTLPLVPGEESTRSARVQLRAKAAETAVEGTGRLDGDRLEAELSLPETPPEALQALVPRSPLAAPASLGAHVSGTVHDPSFEIDVHAGRGHLWSTGQAHLDEAPRVEMSIAARDVDLAQLSESLPSSDVGFDLRADLRRLDGKEGVAAWRAAIGGKTLPSSIAREPVPPVEVHADVDAHEVRATAKTHHGTADLVAHAVLSGGKLEAGAQLDAGPSIFAGVSLEGAHIEAELGGALDSLAGRVDANFSGLRRGKLALGSLMVIAEGTRDTVDVAVAGSGGSVDVVALEATVEPRGALRVSHLSVRAERAGRVMVLSSPEITFGHDVVDVARVRLEGVGQPVEAELHQVNRRTFARVVAPDIDFAAVSAFLWPNTGRLSGHGNIFAEIDSGPGGTTGTASAGVTGARWKTLPEVVATLELVVDTARVEGRMRASADLGQVDLAVRLDAGRPILGLSSLINATGNVILSTTGVPFDKLCATLQCSGEVARSLLAIRGGTARAQLEIARTPPSAGANDTKVAFSFEADDTNGQLAFLNASSECNLAHAVALRRLPADAPLQAHFGVAARPVEQLPPFLRPFPFSGRLEAHGYAEGTIAKPFFVTDVRGSGLRASPTSPAMELDWITTYDLEDAASDIELKMGERTVLRASFQAEIALEQLLGTPGLEPWSAGLFAEIDGLPLAALPGLVEHEALGSLFGSVSVSGLHQSPKVAGRFSIDDLRIGDDAIGPVALSLEADAQSCLVSLDAGSPEKSEAGRAVLRARAGCHWKNATIPMLARDEKAEAALDATRFPLAAIEPLLSSVFGRIRGVVDAHLSGSGRPDEGAGRWAVRGDAHVQRASVLPLLLGREINALDVQASADGSGTVQIAQVTGEMGAGAFSGQGSLTLRENAIDHAHAELHVAKRHSIPVTMEGVSYGTVWGDVIADGHVADDQFLVDLKAPTLRLELPPQRTGNLERLENNPAVVVLQPLSAEPPATAVGGGPGPGAKRAPRIVATVELGDDVGVSRDDLKVDLTTMPPPQNPKISLDGEVTIDGSIRILGGRVPVAGRVFRVERGVVQFGGDDPGNPAVDVDAVYEGPDTSITIKVHVGGTAKDLKLTLQSTPAKSQSEILSILTFGEAPATTGIGGLGGPGGTSTVSGAAGSAAAGVGSAILTTGLNQVLSQSVIPIRTSVSTGTSATASASASIDLSERIRIEYIRSFGAPSQVGQQRDDNQFALDWRFKSRWTLRTIVGTLGTAALDLLWQRWY
jgi:hypothetical protein